jgi:dihydropyrimidinase
MGNELPNPHAGHNAGEIRMPFLFTEGVCKNRFDVNRFVEIFSANAAKLFGLYPRKGVLAVGSDADVVVLNPDAEKTVRIEDLQNVDHSVYAGLKLRGFSDLTICRGRVLVEDGRYGSEPGFGKFIPGKIDERYRKRPVIS